MDDQRRLGRGVVRHALPALSPGPRDPRGSPRAPSPRAKRLRAPLLLGLAALLAFESIGGLVLLFARVAFGATPGVALHVAAGLLLTVVYAIYQITHWNRVAPWRSRPDYVLGLIAAVTLTATDLTGLVLGWEWWITRLDGTGIVHYPVALSAIHTLGTMLVLAFASAHLAAVLVRDRSGRASGVAP